MPQYVQIKAPNAKYERYFGYVEEGEPGNSVDVAYVHITHKPDCSPVSPPKRRGPYARDQLEAGRCS